MIVLYCIVLYEPFDIFSIIYSLKLRFRISPELIANEFNKLFAASTSVQSLPGKAASKEVLIQGEVSKRAMEYLIAKYQVPKKYFEIKEKGKKAK